MDQFQFRPLKQGDCEQVLSLFSQLTSNVSAEIDFDAMIADPKCHCVVLQDENSIAGFGALVRYTVPTKGEVGRLEDIIIDEKYRGKGFGKKLIQELIAIANEENISKMYLTSNPQRLAARKLYESFGFTKGETDVFYLDLR